MDKTLEKLHEALFLCTITKERLLFFIFRKIFYNIYNGRVWLIKAIKMARMAKLRAFIRKKKG